VPEEITIVPTVDRAPTTIHGGNVIVPLGFDLSKIRQTDRKAVSTLMSALRELQCVVQTVCVKTHLGPMNAFARKDSGDRHPTVKILISALRKLITVEPIQSVETLKEVSFVSVNQVSLLQRMGPGTVLTLMNVRLTILVTKNLKTVSIL
jgi:hypothetical protein